MKTLTSASPVAVEWEDGGRGPFVAVESSPGLSFSVSLLKLLARAVALVK